MVVYSPILKIGTHCAFFSGDPSSTWKTLQQLDIGDIAKLPRGCCEPAECAVSRLLDVLTCHKVHTFVSHLQQNRMFKTWIVVVVGRCYETPASGSLGTARS